MGKKVDKVPSPTVKRMAYEANITAKHQVAMIMNRNENNTFLYDGTTKHQQKCMTYQISKDAGLLIASLTNTQEI